MRLSISLLASLGLVGTAAAQTNNEFFLYSGSTNFTTRSTLPGASEGEICQRYPGMAVDPATSGFAGFFNGLGQTDDGSGNPVNRINGMRYVLQDQSGITQEPYEVGAKPDDPAAPGNVDPVNDYFRAGPFNTPTSSNSGPVAWIFTLTFTTPFDGVPAQGDIWAFVDVPANPAWTGDGVSVHMSGWTNSPADNPNINATIINFINVVDQTGIAANPGQPPQGFVAVNNTRFQRIWFTTQAATLKVGADIDPNAQVCPNPNYGCAGLYPDQNPGRTDGVSFRFLDGNLPQTNITVLGNFGPTTVNPPIPVNQFVPGSIGSIYLSLPWLTDAFAAGVTAADGLYEQITFAFPFALSAPVGVMTFQAFALDLSGTPRIVSTNSAGFDAQ